ncbi:ABC transporter ATP-binding protein [Pontibacillus halophilus JSM 076056 = DSM 19796]|uniref:ABC transporter ATP-binding protein n=1 Tax=Pontibacillus halophilus JSM 076056 = DSM 19796 TaxID=1385510 RepID=A0A0A5GMR5_9BACI|nr:YtzI protein [Pontibacillus halophilus]KGX92455.1 ABC transporter ATP-binding protein [Pontibacillus halophilus JSM 076056 = DSM 19796]
MFAILIVCLVIIFVVLMLTIFTITSGYKYKHTVDPLPSKEQSPSTQDNDGNRSE